MAASQSSEQEPLLGRTPASSSDSYKSNDSYGTPSTHASEEAPEQQPLLESIEDDVLPETSVLGRNLGKTPKAGRCRPT